VSDPSGDGNGPNGLDIKAISHVDTADTVTYFVDFYNTPPHGPYAVKWFMGNSPDALDEACIILSWNNANGDQFSVFDAPCGAVSGTPREGPKNASRPGSNEIQFTVSLDTLKGTGLHTGANTQYYYRVKAFCAAQSTTTTTTAAPTTTTTAAPTTTTTSATTTTTASTTTTTAPPATTTTTTTPANTCDAGPNAAPSDVAPDNDKAPLAHVQPGVPAATNGGGGGSGATTTTLPGTTQSAATVSKSVVDAGDTLTMSGNGFAPNASPLTITLLSDPVVLGTTAADATGHYSVVVRIPANTLPGTHTLVVSGAGADGHNHQSVATITVRLPRTGASNTGRTTAAGVAILALGFAVLSLAYYERHLVSVGASKATAAITTAFKRFDI
jgi:hypothetical protein